MLIYALFDLKRKEYGPLFLAENDASMRRELQDNIPGSKSIIARYPADFMLTCLGSFDTFSGEIESEVRSVDLLSVICPPTPPVELSNEVR